jgi:ubiquinone/menaquinone biosynthesis C-methylase UbiE
MIDEEEERRLNIQHRGWKATNGGKNYVAPMDQALGMHGDGKRIIDIGTGTSPEYHVQSLMSGTGIWAVEMAREFPKAQVVGLDLVPYATNELDLPSNLELVLGDCAQGLAYPDGHFDIVHARLIVGGIRDWKALLDEVVRITKRGGLMVFAESCCPWPLIDPAPEGVGKGFLELMDLMSK